MLNFGNKEFRNIQEQVYKNMQDIASLQELAQVGINVQYIEASVADLPTEDVEDGTMAAVGSAVPYTLYVYNEEEWKALGQFPMPGPQGPQGPQGVQGVQGPQGNVGPQGQRGSTGPQGPQGIQGPRGYTGETGATGPQGEQGIQGPQGNDGVTPNITVNVSAESSESASASVVKSGTLAEPVFSISFGLPKGEQGIQGIQGPKGDTGETGPQGIQGPQGEPGQDGQDGTQVSGTNDGTNWTSITVAEDTYGIPAAQVQPDWEANSGMGEILHKPEVLPTLPIKYHAENDNYVISASDWALLKANPENYHLVFDGANPRPLRLIKAQYNNSLHQTILSATYAAFDGDEDNSSAGYINQYKAVVDFTTEPEGATVILDMDTLGWNGVRGASDGTNWLRLTLGSETYNIPAAVSGTYSGSNWSTITIGSETKNIPAESSALEVISPAYDANGQYYYLSNTELANVVAHPENYILSIPRDRNNLGYLIKYRAERVIAAYNIITYTGSLDTLDNTSNQQITMFYVSLNTSTGVITESSYNLVAANDPLLTPAEPLQTLKVYNRVYGLPTYQTTAPTEAATDGGIHIVYLTAEPGTKYSGYIYMIAES